MRITVEAIDANSMRPLGYTPIPSFMVKFTSPIVRGEARFVPASGNACGCAGQFFDVEVNQDLVTALGVVTHGPSIESVTALPESGAFQVQGVVTSIVPLAEPAGAQVITVSADGALFTLGSEELGGMKLSLGERVTFTAHGLSLWDEAI